MILGGVASTEDIDADEQFMSPKGFDTSQLMTTGFVNWNHLAKHTPEAIIGEPIDAKVQGNEFHIKAKLYQKPLAVSTYQLVQALEKSGSKRKIGWSIEGKVLETDPTDPRRVTKAAITGVALTPSPKNPHTFANIMKGIVDHDEYEYDIQKSQDPNGGEVEYIVDITLDGIRRTVDKAYNIKVEKMDTESVSPVTKESLETGKKKLKKVGYFEKELSKSEAYQYIFENFDVNIQEAKEICNLFLNVERSISNDMSKITISQDAIQKAQEILNIATEEISKGVHMSVSEETQGGKEEVMQKAVDFAKACMSEGKSKDEYKKAAMEKGYDEDTVEKAYAEASVQKSEEPEIQKGKEEAVIGGAPIVDPSKDIMKAITDMNTSISERFGAVGTLIQAQNQHSRESQEKIEKSISDLTDRLNKVEQVSQGRKSIGNVSYVQRFDDDIQKGGMEGKKVYNVADYYQRQELANLFLEKASDVNHPMRNEYGQAISSLESQMVISARIQQDLAKNNILVTKQMQ